MKNPKKEIIAPSFNEASLSDIKSSFSKAREAFDTLKNMSIQERLCEITKVKKYIIENREKIVDRIVEETGKTRTDALIAEVLIVVDTISYYEKNASKHLSVKKAKTPLLLFPKKSRIYYEPLGTVLIISPWNYPVNLSINPIITAFIAGNSVVFKPSEWTPLKGLIEEMLSNTIIMKSAVQVVYGGKEVGQKLIDEKPAKIFFTGSTSTGKKIMAQAASNLIPVELELGGKDPMIVFEDANLEKASDGAIWGGFMNTGQTCVSVEHLLVHEKIHDSFTELMRKKILKLKCPDKLDADDGELDIGFMTTPFQIKEIEEQLEDARSKGAKILTGGMREPGVIPSLFFPPTLVVDVDEKMKIVKNETFGPVIAVSKFSTEEDAIRIANSTSYGLSSSVWSKDIEKALRVAGKLTTGSVSINNVIMTFANPDLPFGGIKESGFGRYKGCFGLHSFSNIKAVMIDPMPFSEMHWFPYKKEKYKLLSKLISALYGEDFIGLIKTIFIAARLQLIAFKNKL